MYHRGVYRAESQAKEEERGYAEVRRKRYQQRCGDRYQYLSYAYHAAIAELVAYQSCHDPACGHSPEQQSRASCRLAFGEASGAYEEGRAPEHGCILHRAV